MLIHGSRVLTLLAESQGEDNYTDVQVEENFVSRELDQFLAQGFGNRFGFGMNHAVTR